ncbi:hypothetical protein ANME2D_00791 [Candidatus Methanoperedens nitroreducens]|uniref:Uncharacterized protein n=1 Tax=Candidatus Methanoperedens nitratireducens TaxID=1392998 RepID=A0A062V9C9_9EURY|nr:hypothetical protein ANME2D_00791 [Candidatus Methanoperedens nitroreducens]
MKEKINLEKEDIVIVLAIIVVLVIIYGILELFYTVPG